MIKKFFFRYRWIFLLISIIFLSGFYTPLLAFNQKGQQGHRGIKVRIKANETPNAPVVEEIYLYPKSYALVIGIDNYYNGWPRLSNAVSDARKVADGLREKGFEVTFKRNLSSEELKSTFEKFFIFKGENPQARLFVWFAGHGHTLDNNGFLVPSDAPSPTDETTRFKYMSLSMRRFGEFVRLAKSRHTYTVFDSCFAGTIFNTRRSIPPAAITRMIKYPVRQFLTSGDSDQSVSDDGRFAKLFLRAIKGDEKADFNNDGYLTGTELGLFMTKRITNLTYAKQTPRFGNFLDEDFDRGDFIFLLPQQKLRSLVSIESNVMGAKVTMDGVYIGRTNLKEIIVSPGKHELNIEKTGYRIYTESTFFEEGEKIVLHINLTPNLIRPAKKSQSKGNLFVNSIPRDSVIIVQNIKERFYQGIPLPAGKYLIIVNAENHKAWKQWVTLESDQKKYVDIKLEQIATPSHAVSPPPNIERKNRNLPISF